MFWSPSAQSQPGLLGDKYDEAIKTAVKKYWPDLQDWKLWKAQLYQESNLKPDVCSSVGACGLAQFMPKTWDDIIKQMKMSNVRVGDAVPAIEAGAFYMMKLRKNWALSNKRPIKERHKLAEASYNAGIGNIIKSQQVCSNALLYDDIINCLPQITGLKSKETIGYVQRIDKWRALLGE